MRKTFCILGLVAITLLASTHDLFAQRRGGGGGRGGFGRGYGYSRGYGYGGYYGGLGYYYGAPYYGGYYGPSYYSAPAVSTYDSVPVVQAPPTQSRQSFYPSDANVASITVMVPNADAQIWIDGAATSQRGRQRFFETPALQGNGTYSIKASWMENGRTMTQERQIQVQPGRTFTVTFQANSSEGIQAPQQSKQ